jgi:formylglycine-generating enzyme required for sulfatase activity
MSLAHRFSLLLLLQLGTAMAQVPAPAAVAPVAAANGCAVSISHSPDKRIAYFRHCADTPEMVSFRGGKYLMGDPVGSGQPYERPQHEVTIPAFAIGRYEVTQDEWEACVSAGGCTDARKPSLPGKGRMPIAGVNWLQAKAYVKWLAAHTGKPYRLPSEAEWEYAARAGATGSYPWGSFAQSMCTYANAFDLTGRAKRPELTWNIECDDGYADAAPVGIYQPNAWGVYDMLGNVWEWVEDCWHPDYNGAPVDGSAWIEGDKCNKRVNRGGGFENGPGTLRLSNRDADPVDSTTESLGFRVALSIAPSTK